MIELPATLLVLVVFAAVLAGLHWGWTRFRHTPFDLTGASFRAFAIAGVLLWLMASSAERTNPGSYSDAAIDTPLFIAVVAVIASAVSARRMKRTEVSSVDVPPPEPRN